MPIEWAIECDNTEAVRLFLNAKPSWCMCSKGHEMIIMQAAALGRTFILNQLIHHTHDLHQTLHSVSALDRAIANNHVQCMRVLLNAQVAYSQALVPAAISADTRELLRQHVVYNLGLATRKYTAQNVFNDVFSDDNLVYMINSRI